MDFVRPLLGALFSFIECENSRLKLFPENLKLGIIMKYIIIYIIFFFSKLNAVLPFMSSFQESVEIFGYAKGYKLCTI